ncbi:bifunctional 5,10-methylenetetrahydrofolate dehydrogenase/5,10-methenyltetrahydrofolate cyclohydrolase [Paenibacillus sp. GCM10027626]|uniref:bifunctional 5,10-methylenetetrahydrofolate dehydrogenase/5,10-methenyltetrahydrofolate cyclohydrolase n=1 Tax=Paenibacillus sp. GCM10027626 TaxID=3273411 RepID=UPI00363C7D3C
MTIMMKAREAADVVYAEICTKVNVLKKQGIQPRLDTILIDGDPASAYYALAKQKIAAKLGIEFQLHRFAATVTDNDVLQLIRQLNANSAVHGIMLELPLPPHLSTNIIAKAIIPMKDIDGVTPDNKLATITGELGLYPATPQACIQLVKHYGYSLNGANVTLVGRGQTVGLPLFHLLQREQATVTVCHSRTPDLAYHLKHADIAFAAAGCPGMITQEMVHPDLVIIDAGINELDNGKIVGDTAASLIGYVKALSPVPGGVGTLTTALLYENLMKAISIQTGEVS